MAKQTKYSIGLSNGDFFDFENPEAHTFDIDVIAQALSKICRYNGHNDGDHHYSVAEHSVYVSYLVPPEDAFEGLMHDTSEAYTGDLQKPFKELIRHVYGPIEERIEAAIAKQFGLRFPYPPSIKVADGRIYKTEREQIATAVTDNLWYKDLEPTDIRIRCLPIKKAKAFFLNRFMELSRDRTEQVSRQRAA